MRTHKKLSDWLPRHMSRVGGPGNLVAGGQKDLSKEGDAVRSVGKKESVQKVPNFFPGTVSLINNLLRKNWSEAGG